ncbi:hypothetical protein [Nocardia jejuensis]|uniref:hypothetical protein n=1 Tax=Nocardia jejuensis TaxID=328049 RepID=UPI000B1FF939|nr:hypothetical protein [Nocardia jejuensis]
MRHRPGLDGVAALVVTVEFTDDGHRALGVEWSMDAETAAHRRLECARIFLAGTRTGVRRMYLDIVDGRPSVALRLPETVIAGEYTIEVDAYGSSSWGDGRLEAHGRSDPFTIAGEAGIGR